MTFFSNHACEDPDLNDEYLIDLEHGDPTVHGDIYHNYTMDLPESYELVYDWRDVLDEFALLHERSPKILMTEAYPIEPDNVFGWYGNAETKRWGSQVAFNFIMISDINAESNAHDFAKLINHWIMSVPHMAQPNWVMGNHDRARLATRFGVERAEQFAILTMMLPGIAVVYNGEEIGMINNEKITFEETQDPWGIGAGEEEYMKYSRDPVRTPFQWDETTNAGFNTGFKPWLPIHENYKTLNLNAQKSDPHSIYHLYKTLIRLKKEDVFKYGETIVKPLNDNVLGFLRCYGDEVEAVAINLGDKQETVDLTSLGEPAKDRKLAEVVIANKGHVHQHHGPIADKFVLGPYDAVVVDLEWEPVDGSASLPTASIVMLILGIIRYLF